MNNIKSSEKFQEKLEEVMNGIGQLFELSKEHDLAPFDEDGVRAYYEESGKCPFQVSGQFDRPSEFLQSFLDIVRVNYEPYTMGSLLLNSNMCFLYEEVPSSPFQLGYVSLTSESEKGLSGFWNEDVIPYIDKCGYSLESVSAIYAVASTGGEKYSTDFLDSVVTVLNSVFSVDEEKSLFAGSVSGSRETKKIMIHSGFCLDPALGKRTRLTLWIFIKPK